MKAKRRYRRPPRMISPEMQLFMLFVLALMASTTDYNLADVPERMLWAVYLVAAMVLVYILGLVFKIIRKWLKSIQYANSSLARLDTMDPFEFEHYAAWLLAHRGYKKCEVTQKGSDYGADVIAKHGRKRVVVQVKRYHGKVGVSAIQQIVAAKAYYKAQEAMIFTNSQLTPAAENLARANDVTIIDRKRLQEWRAPKK